MLWTACYSLLLQRILFSPGNKHCSFYPKVGSYLENLWHHVQWKEACAVWRRQTSSVKRGKNKSDATHLVTESHYTNLSILNSMKLWHNKERKESRKGCKSTFFKTSGESRKSVKRDIGTKKTNLCNAIQLISSSSSSSSSYYYYYYYYYFRFFLCFSFCISFRLTDRLTDHHSRSPGQSLLSNTFSS